MCRPEDTQQYINILKAYDILKVELFFTANTVPERMGTAFFATVPIVLAIQFNVV